MVSIFYYSWMPVTIQKIIIMSFAATLVFILIDAFIKNISDNILNPLLTGLAMWIIFLF